MSPPPLALREQARQRRFDSLWTQQLNKVFADVAPYYDRANFVASLGLWNWILGRFMSTIDVRPGQRMLDVCAGTNAVGIALLLREPSLEVLAIDRSVAMQEVGRQRAEARGFRIESHIGDVHELPFPDNHFDVITLQWASRHLRIRRVFEEILRVLKPGGRFYHCDMLRPRNRLVEKLYYAYLRLCLSFTAVLFGSGPSALNARKYFINALEMFYSADELSGVLRADGFRSVAARTLFAGTIGFHHAAKPRPGSIN
jgi:demethylmenaquinone methyltransferase/2-methoxy-6-polyprenyl-1,4-benzoquinol methylase